MRIVRPVMLFFGLFMMSVGLFGCRGGGSGSAETSVNIRIENQSDLDIDQFYLGAGPGGGATKNTSYGRIRSGKTTDYKAIEPNINNYRKMNFNADGKGYLNNNTVSELTAGGYYTFSYDIVSGNVTFSYGQDK